MDGELLRCRGGLARWDAGCRAGRGEQCGLALQVQGGAGRSPRGAVRHRPVPALSTALPHSTRRRSAIRRASRRDFVRKAVAASALRPAGGIALAGGPRPGHIPGIGGSQSVDGPKVQSGTVVVRTSVPGSNPGGASKPSGISQVTTGAPTTARADCPCGASRAREVSQDAGGVLTLRRVARTRVVDLLTVTRLTGTRPHGVCVTRAPVAAGAHRAHGGLAAAAGGPPAPRSRRGLAQRHARARHHAALPPACPSGNRAADGWADDDSGLRLVRVRRR